VYVASVSQPLAPYLRIATDIRGRIERGELKPGERVPSVTGLAESYQVSHGTARRALATLKAWGLTDTVPGWATFVKATPS
jgi:DNA-binding GntR family transcriptional regulator